MAKYIAQASIDERGKIAGGSAGDQTKKEVNIKAWYQYSPKWNVVLRLSDEKIRKQTGNNMIDIANNNNIGYDQNQRNTLLTQAKKVNFDMNKIATKCECDCSSAVTVAILGAIYKVKGKTEYEKAYKALYSGNNCRTTSTLKKALVTTLKIAKAYTDSAYLTGTSKLSYGDIILKEGYHVVCYIDAGKKVSISSSKTETKPQAKISYYAKYTGSSSKIDTIFKKIGVPSKYYGSYTKRKPIAKANGISDYEGTASQNVKLINLAKQGKLKKA